MRYINDLVPLQAGAIRAAGDWDMHGEGIEMTVDPLLVEGGTIATVDADTKTFTPSGTLLDIGIGPGGPKLAAFVSTTGYNLDGSMKFIMPDFDKDLDSFMQMVIVIGDFANSMEVAAVMTGADIVTDYIAIQMPPALIGGTPSGEVGEFTMRVGGVSEPDQPLFGGVAPVAGDVMRVRFDPILNRVYMQINATAETYINVFDFNGDLATFGNYKVIIGLMFGVYEILTPTKLLTYDLSDTTGGRPGWLKEGDTVPADSIRSEQIYRVTGGGRFNGKITRVGDHVILNNARNDIIVLHEVNPDLFLPATSYQPLVDVKALNQIIDHHFDSDNNGFIYLMSWLNKKVMVTDDNVDSPLGNNTFSISMSPGDVVDGDVVSLAVNNQLTGEVPYGAINIYFSSNSAVTPNGTPVDSTNCRYRGKFYHFTFNATLGRFILTNPDMDVDVINRITAVENDVNGHYGAITIDGTPLDMTPYTSGKCKVTALDSNTIAVLYLVGSSPRVRIFKLCLGKWIPVDAEYTIDAGPAIIDYVDICRLTTQGEDYIHGTYTMAVLGSGGTLYIKYFAPVFGLSTMRTYPVNYSVSRRSLSRFNDTIVMMVSLISGEEVLQILDVGNTVAGLDPVINSVNLTTSAEFGESGWSVTVGENGNLYAGKTLIDDYLEFKPFSYDAALNTFAGLTIPSHSVEPPYADPEALSVSALHLNSGDVLFTYKDALSRGYSSSFIINLASYPYIEKNDRQFVEVRHSDGISMDQLNDEQIVVADKDSGGVNRIYVWNLNKNQNKKKFRATE